MKNNLAAPDAFAKFVKVINHTGACLMILLECYSMDLPLAWRTALESMVLGLPDIT